MSEAGCRPTVFVDGDACPVTAEVEQAGAAHELAVIVVSDAAHAQRVTTAELVMVDVGRNAVDYVIVTRSRPGDVVVTNDLGLVAMLLAKRVHVVSSDGEVFKYTPVHATLGVHRLMVGRRRAGARRTAPLTAWERTRFARRLDRLLTRWFKKRRGD